MLALKSLTPYPPAMLPSLPETDFVCTCGDSLPLQVRLGLRSRTRPVVEGRWACSTRCLERHISTIVRREQQGSGSRRPHRHRVPLGLVLLATGAVTHDQLRHALALQHGTADRIGEVLQRECGLSEREVAQALAVQWGCGTWELGEIHANRVAAVAPAAVRESAGMLPVRVSRDGRIHLAFANAPDAQSIFAVQRIHGAGVNVCIAPESEWAAANSQLAKADGVAVEVLDCDGLAEVEQAVVRTLRRLQPVEARMVRVHGLYWLRLWLEPAALLGGASQREDVLDVLYRTPQTAFPS